MAPLQPFDGIEIGRDVVADRGVWAATGLDGFDPVVGEDGVLSEEVGVLGEPGADQESGRDRAVDSSFGRRSAIPA